MVINSKVAFFMLNSLIILSLSLCKYEILLCLLNSNNMLYKFLRCAFFINGISICFLNLQIIVSFLSAVLPREILICLLDSQTGLLYMLCVHQTGNIVMYAKIR